MLNLGFLASGNGTLMQAVIRACQENRLDARPSMIISNNRQSGALQFAIAQRLKWQHLSSATHKDPNALDKAILDAFQQNEVDLVLLLGYLKLLGPATIAAYNRHILNIHPALLPKYGGPGMYGLNVHAAVIAAGDKETGITIHHVNSRYDEGGVVAQCKVTVEPDDTPETLAARVLEREQLFIVETLQNIVAGKIVL